MQLQIAKQLCQWREQIAQKKDRPRRWIAKDDWLIEMSRQKPVSIEDLSTIRELNEKFITHHGQTLLKIIEDAEHLAPSEWPKLDAVNSLSSHQQALGDCMMALCRTIAEDNQIALATLATRKDIDNLIVNRKNRSGNLAKLLKQNFQILTWRVEYLDQLIASHQGHQRRKILNRQGVDTGHILLAGNLN